MSGNGVRELFSPAQCLAFVERSPEAVATHDKPAWLALFARYSLIEDPVGSAPHITGTYDSRAGYRGRGRLSRFYDTFIAPNTIRFHIDRDSVCGLQVMRDLTIEITMSPRVEVQVPVHLLYELIVEEGELKVFRLAAHWELWPMLKQQMASGWPFLRVGGASSLRMLRHMGIAGMAGFMRALSSVGEKGKERIARFARHVNAAEPGALEGLFASPDTEILLAHDGSRCSISTLAQAGRSVNFSKVLAAGNVVSATMEYQEADQHFHGVAVFELNRSTLQIISLTFYWSAN